MTSETGWNFHDSSHIDASKYDESERTLDIKFANGSIYRYHGVSPGEHRSFLSAPSAGEYHSRFIKHYECEQVK